MRKALKASYHIPYVSLSKALICSLLATLFTLSAVTIAEATELTKDEKAKQLAEREQALKDMKTTKTTDTELVGPSLNVITVEISRACKMMNSTQCPKFSDLISFDNTIQKYVGKLTDQKRLKSYMKNPSVIYWNIKDTVVCVDCPWDIYKNSKHITVGTPFTYKLNDDKTIVNNTRYEYKNRYVENCVSAKVAWLPKLFISEKNKIINLLNDTINYLKSGCTKTDYDPKVAIKMPSLNHDIKTTASYKYQKWLESAKKLKTVNCLKSTEC